MMMKTRGEPVSYICSECGSENIIHDEESGEIICGSCGLVIAESTIYMGPEWRAFTPEERKLRSRVGLPLSFSVHDKGLSTMFRVGRDASGRRIPPKTRFQMFRLRRWQRSLGAHSSIDRNLTQAMSELERLTDQLYISKPF